MAARNVLLSDDGQAKVISLRLLVVWEVIGDFKLSIEKLWSLSGTQVADFGLASTDGATIDSGKLPIKWTAPEVGHFL